MNTGKPKHAGCHTFRHCFCNSSFEMGVDIRPVQEWLGHKDLKTTMIYTHVMKKPGIDVKSPLDNKWVTISSMLVYLCTDADILLRLTGKTSFCIPFSIYHTRSKALKLLWLFNIAPGHSTPRSGFHFRLNRQDQSGAAGVKPARSPGRLKFRLLLPVLCPGLLPPAWCSRSHCSVPAASILSGRTTDSLAMNQRRDVQKACTAIKR